jgi:hypothetical protein
MVSGALAHESKKRAAQAALFLCATLSVLDNRPERIESFKLHILRAVFRLAAFSRRGLNELRWTDGRCALLVMAPLRYADGMSAYRGRPEVIGTPSERREW